VIEEHPRVVPDVIARDLAVLFCGINPGSLSGQLGQHFARPGNRFWKLLHLAGFTDRLVAPAEQWSLLDYRIGITNLVARTTASAAEVTLAELRAGSKRLGDLVGEWQPRWVAVLGVQAYRKAFARPAAAVGLQLETLGGSGLWLLPNPSGLQARYQVPDMLPMYRELKAAAY
jgi:TDG/mug DNA glycosylase family protein